MSIDPTRCPRCGQSNHCALAAGASKPGPCWCLRQPQLAGLPRQLCARACWCRRCLAEMAATGGGKRAEAGCDC